MRPKREYGGDGRFKRRTKKKEQIYFFTKNQAPSSRLEGTEKRHKSRVGWVKTYEEKQAI